MKIGWYEKFVLSFLITGLQIVKIFAIQYPEFGKKYQSILQAIVQTAETIKPYVESPEAES